MEQFPCCLLLFPDACRHVPDVHMFLKSVYIIITEQVNFVKSVNELPNGKDVLYYKRGNSQLFTSSQLSFAILKNRELHLRTDWPFDDKGFSIEIEDKSKQTPSMVDVGAFYQSDIEDVKKWMSGLWSWFSRISTNQIK